MVGRPECSGAVEVWQTHARLASVLEPVLWWLEPAELARAGAVCRAWRAAAAGSRAWRHHLAARATRPADAHAALKALAQLYGGACPWRELYVAAAAPWRLAARVAPTPPARLAAAALSRAGDRLALVAEDGGVSVWHARGGAWRRAGAGSVAALGWAGVARAEWAPARAPRLLLGGRAPLAASRGALAVLAPSGARGAWRVVARAGGAAGCWAGAAGFVSLELTRLSAPDQPPHFATDVWLNAASQEVGSEFAGVAERVLRVYNEEPALITQVVCVETPLDERAAQEWAGAEAEAETEADWEQDAASPLQDAPLDEQLPGEAYYRATCGGDRSPGARVRLLLAACGARLLALRLAAAAPPPLRVRTGLARRVQLQRERREQRALAAALPPAAPASPAELRAGCDAPAARLRLPGRALALAAHDSGRCVWATLAGGGALCVSLPALRVLRVVPPAPRAAGFTPGDAHYVRPDARGDRFGSPCGSGSGSARVWGPAWGPGALLEHAAPALALLLTPSAALVLTEQALHVWQCVAPRAADTCGDSASRDPSPDIDLDDC